MRMLRFVLNNLDGFGRIFYICLVVAALDSVAGFSIPYMLSEFTSQQLNEDRARLLILLLACAFFCSVCLQYILRRFGEAMVGEFSYYLKLKYYRQLESLPVSRLMQQHSGYFYSLVSRVCDTAGRLVNTMLWLVSYCFITLGLFYFITARESVPLAIANCLVLILFLGISVYLSMGMVPLIRALNLASARFTERFVDFMANLITVKKLGIYEYSAGVLESNFTDTRKRIEAVQRYHAWRWFFLHSIYGIALVGTLSYLVYQISLQSLESAVLVIFIATFTTVRGQVERLSEMVKDVLEISAFVRDLNDVMGAAQDDSAKLKPVSAFQELQLCNIEFIYPGGQLPIRVPEFSLRTGEVVAIVGESGQGKSTLLNLLAYFQTPLSGKAQLNGIDYADLGHDFFRKHMALISQEVELFDLSLRDNLVLGKDIEDQRIEELLSNLGLANWLASLPQGLNTRVGEKGIILSAGQKQRVNIARGLLLERDILLLDEPTAHLDKDSEENVKRVLSECLKDRSAVLVSHRSALLDLCQRTYIFRDHQLSLV